MIYFGSDDRQLYALAPDGFKKWTFTTGNWIRSTPAVAEDGTVYVGSYDHSLYAIAPDGSKKWEFVTDQSVTASPTIGRDVTVFFGSWNGRMYAVRGGAPLAEDGWPRFRGNLAQSGYLSEAAVEPMPQPDEVALVVEPPIEIEPPAPARPRNKSPLFGSWWNKVLGSGKSVSKAVEPAPLVSVENDATTVVEIVETDSATVGEVMEISNARELMGPFSTPVPEEESQELEVEDIVVVGVLEVLEAGQSSSPVTAEPTPESGRITMMTLVDGGAVSLIFQCLSRSLRRYRSSSLSRLKRRL